MKLSDYANDREDVVLFWVSGQCPTGDYVTLGYPDISFAEDLGLLDLEGEVDEDGDYWLWDGEGEPRDYLQNSITKLHAYVDHERWGAMVEDYESSR